MPTDPYAVPAERRREDYQELAKMPAPPVETLNEETGPEFFLSHMDCPMCSGQSKSLECEEFTPARMRGICHTFYVVIPLYGAGDFRAWVIDFGDGGPPPVIVDRYGPFDSYEDAVEWASAVIVAELRREHS